MIRKGTPNHRNCAASASPVGPAPMIKQGMVSGGSMVQPRPASERGAGELPRPREPARSVAHELPDLLEAGARVLVAEGDQPLDVLLLERQVAQQVRAALLAHP